MQRHSEVEEKRHIVLGTRVQRLHVELRINVEVTRVSVVEYHRNDWSLH